MNHKQVVICALLATVVFYLLIYAIIGHSATIDAQVIANAIYKAENSKTWPYGIKHHYKHTTPRQACINTINHQYARFLRQGQETDFIVFLAGVYCPASTDYQGHKNWIKNVKFFLCSTK